MEIRQLKYFVKIVELGSLTRAAEVLFIAQPALSQQMASLERDLGVKLLGRSVRGVTMTEAGEAFYKQANIILKQVDMARHVVLAAHEQPSGSVSVGLPSSIANVLAVPLVRNVRTRFPNVLLEFHESPSFYLDELVMNGRIDIGLLFGSSRTKGLKFRKLLTENLYLVGAAGSFRNDSPVPLAELIGYPLLVPSRPNSIRLQLDHAFAQAGLKYTPSAEINSTPVVKRLVEDGLGFTVIPWCAADAEMAAGRLQGRKVVEPEVCREVSICYSDKMPMSFAAEAVCELMVDTVSGLVEGGRWRGVRIGQAAVQ